VVNLGPLERGLERLAGGRGHDSLGGLHHLLRIGGPRAQGFGPARGQARDVPDGSGHRAAQLGQGIARRQPQQQQLGQLGVRGGLAPQDLGERCGESLVLGDRLFAKETPVQERVLGQQALAKPVNRRDGRAIEAQQGIPDALARGRVDQPALVIRRACGVGMIG
jgi:hypothetical protein